VYQWLVRRLVLSAYRAVTAGDHEAALRACAQDVVQAVPGQSPLGGTRRSVAGYRAWFERVRRLFPSLKLDVHAVAVSGMPWNTTVAVAWTDTVTAPDGREFRNDGMHLATMRWGRLTSIRYYWDTELVAAACAHVAALGVDEAAEAPLA
jgi:ketosteroid isomerase-like protein